MPVDQIDIDTAFSALRVGCIIAYGVGLMMGFVFGRITK